jgi:hypothetical protein
MHEGFDGTFRIAMNAAFAGEVHCPFECSNITSHKLPIKGPKKNAQNLHKEALVFVLYLKAGNNRLYKIAGMSEFFHNRKYQILEVLPSRMKSHIT